MPKIDNPKEFFKIYQDFELGDLIQLKNFFNHRINQICAERKKTLTTIGATTFILVEKEDGEFCIPYKYFASESSIINPFFKDPFNNI